KAKVVKPIRARAVVRRIKRVPPTRVFVNNFTSPAASIWMQDLTLGTGRQQVCSPRTHPRPNNGAKFAVARKLIPNLHRLFHRLFAPVTPSFPPLYPQDHITVDPLQ